MAGLLPWFDDMVQLHRGPAGRRVATVRVLSRRIARFAVRCFASGGRGVAVLSPVLDRRPAREQLMPDPRLLT